ncbi:MAG: peptidoglycan-associated lipoprotein Pal [Alphaproteobacteria bacterium]|nr:MAG: peptidoglycan-associated lipoprotein Pal [Alphaproteobacteria bacterium]
MRAQVIRNLVFFLVMALGLAACAKQAPAPQSTPPQPEQATAQPERQEAGAPPSLPAVGGTSALGRESLEDRYGPPTEAALTAFAGDRVYFAFDSAELTPQARATLEKQAEWLKHHPDVRVIIEGHTDERGTREYNLALGERRANAVKNYLVALGIAPERIETISYGKERPAVLGTGEAVWRLNRRAVTKVITPGV